ncbi:MAG: proline dehydrogenase family protein [Candidatus Promineifilaceae bacterium]
MTPAKSKRLHLTLPAIIGGVLLLLLIYQYGERWLRNILIYLSHASWARDMVSTLPVAKQVAGRFVAGETADEAMSTTLTLNQQSMLVTLDYLGESVSDSAEAVASKDEILSLFKKIHDCGGKANVSIKLSQLGLKIQKELALDNLRQILQEASKYQNKVRIDMEESQVVDDTLDIYRTMRDRYGFDNVGVVIQAYLYRSEKDIQGLVEEGAWVRLCKGAYAEPPEIAFPEKADTDANYIKLLETMLSEKARKNGVYIGIATHDEKMIDAAIRYVKEHQIPKDAFEFQMLYGIRRELQEDLVRQGYRLRIYVPYGTAWYPYFVRRLAERPANLWFFVSNFFRS